MLNVFPGFSAMKKDVNEIVRTIEFWLKNEPSRRLIVMFNEAGAWLEQSGRKSMMVEMPDQGSKPRDICLEMGGKSNTPVGACVLAG